MPSYEHTSDIKLYLTTTPVGWWIEIHNLSPWTLNYSAYTIDTGIDTIIYQQLILRCFSSHGSHRNLSRQMGRIILLCIPDSRSWDLELECLMEPDFGQLHSGWKRYAWKAKAVQLSEFDNLLHWGPRVRISAYRNLRTYVDYAGQLRGYVDNGPSRRQLVLYLPMPTLCTRSPVRRICGTNARR